MELYRDCKIYGPYSRKDNRKHIVVVWPGGKKQTVSYPKYLMERHLGRYLERGETVDHIDSDFTNDNITNLQVLSREANARKSFTDRRLKRKVVSFICPECNTGATREENYVKNNRRQGKVGPFCSRRCAGKHNAKIRYS